MSWIRTQQTDGGGFKFPHSLLSSGLPSRITTVYIYIYNYNIKASCFTIALDTLHFSKIGEVILSASERVCFFPSTRVILFPSPFLPICPSSSILSCPKNFDASLSPRSSSLSRCCTGAGNVNRPRVCSLSCYVFSPILFFFFNNLFLELD